VEVGVREMQLKKKLQVTAALSLSLSVIFKNKALFGYMSGFITIRFKSITQSMP
jgi:hypothetical protein